MVVLRFSVWEEVRGSEGVRGICCLKYFKDKEGVGIKVYPLDKKLRHVCW